MATDHDQTKSYTLSAFDIDEIKKAFDCMDAGYYQTAEFHFRNIVYDHRRQNELRQNRAC